MQHATLLLLVQDDQILLAMKKRGFGANRYNGVGGKIEPGESIEAALTREAQEEIGITPIAPLKVARLQFRNQDVEGANMLVHVYVANDWEGEPTESEEMAPEWFYMDMIPYDKMWHGDIHWLPHVLEGNGVVASFTFDEDDEIINQDVAVVDLDRVE